MRYLFPAILGICGIAVLVSLGVWQVQRLAWKEAMLAEIDARITAVPVEVPATADPEADRYLPVTARGQLGQRYLSVLASVKQVGAVHRVVTTLTLESGRVLLVDLGTFPVGSAGLPIIPRDTLTVNGNLHWPDEVDGFTPDPDGDLWFARAVGPMAEALGTEPLMIVTRSTDPALPNITPHPVSSVGIPNDHLGYAITWFGLALVWAGMTLFLMWRIKRRTA